jgi:hypothetical protein
MAMDCIATHLPYAFTFMPEHFSSRLAERVRTFPAPVVYLFVIVFLASAVNLVLGSPVNIYLSVLAMIIAGTVLVWRYLDANFTQHRIRSTFSSADQWPVLTRVYPLYKWVDLYRATSRVTEEHSYCRKLLTEHPMPLKYLLQESFLESLRMPLKPPTMMPRKVSPSEEIFLPADSIWLIRDPASLSHGAIVRAHLISYGQMVQLEVASKISADATKIIDAILDSAAKNSIYRQHIISPVFQRQVKSSFRDDEGNTGFDLQFEPDPMVTDEQIILDENVRRVVERTVIDFHERRTELMQYGLPGRRGILFYGPPGTGKTYTCKYIAHKLDTATTVIATGHALTQIKAVCDLAKMFQPSLVILEDVDLMFSERDSNPYTPILGELLDELDGFQQDDQIIFVLTTNAIERVEGAIKNRPGRISQCIYLGPPNPKLRREYLSVLLKPYNTKALNIDQIVSETEGVSQAFLKEMIFRAVQVATEHNVDGEGVILKQSDVTTAIGEMTAGGGRWGKRIIGFQVEP